MAKDQADKNKEKTAKVKRPTPLKRDMQNAKRNIRNRTVKSQVRSAIRQYEDTLAGGNASETQTKLSRAHSLLDKAAQKGILKKNTASRTKARLQARLA